jgi:hypothetical protein
MTIKLECNIRKKNNHRYHLMIEDGLSPIFLTGTFGLMPGRSTMEAIFLIRQFMERYREQKKDMHMVFIDLEKGYDKVPMNIMWWTL